MAKFGTSNQNRTISLKAAVRSCINKQTYKAWVCGRSPTEIAGSNHVGGMDVCRKCCVLSGRGLCDGLISPPEEFYRVWRVVECDLETSRMRRSWIVLSRSATGGGRNIYIYIYVKFELSALQENV